jgi:hypothetical protein
MEEIGWIYCMSNPSMPDLVKVGQTGGDPRERAAQLYTTGVPTEFHVEFAKKVKGYIEKEKQLHVLLAKHFERPNSSREFFRCKSTDVYEFFELIEGVYMTGASTPDPHNLRKYAKKESALR